MGKHKLKFFIWSSLVALFLTGFYTYFLEGKNYMGNSYTERDDFQWQIDDFYMNFGPAVLNRIDIEARKKDVFVTKSEIMEHRNRYGTLAEQIGNIEEQYAERIADAEAGKSEKLESALIIERDEKTDVIRKNFEDDKYVEVKIRTEKMKELERFWNERASEMEDHLTLPVAYELTDIKTGETFSSGDISVPAIYKEEFNLANGYFKAESIELEDGYSDNSYGDETLYYSEDGDPAKSETVALFSTDDSIKNSAKNFEGTVIIPESAMAEGSLGRDVKAHEEMKYAMYVLLGLATLALVLLLTVFRFKGYWVAGGKLDLRYDAMKIDLKVVSLLLSFLGLILTLEIFTGGILWYLSQNNLSNWISLGMTFSILVLFIWGTVFQLVLIVRSLKVKGGLEHDIAESYLIRFIKAFQDMFLKKTIGIQTLILLIGFFLAGIGFAAVVAAPVLIVAYIPAVIFLGLPALYIFVRRSAYLNQIIIATEAMAAGRLQNEIAVKGKSPLAEHAKNLNNLREGVRVSMKEQAKSERLKTELITNVSHDLRTPLTSIITYTDLLKKEDLPAVERAKYVDILDKKSQRLKVLIEDLFEVSKMASGNMELTKQRVDLTQLLQQALAEHSEEITGKGLDFRVILPESALVAHIDGKRWWRVLDNLIVNAIKYTLAGTRVYVTLRKLDDNAEFVVKNITKYELGENTDELFERFKRADASRHTDGSGLGLAIAQSIVDMHNGEMNIEVDGDLFKVTVSVPIIK